MHSEACMHEDHRTGSEWDLSPLWARPNLSHCARCQASWLSGIFAGGSFPRQKTMASSRERNRTLLTLFSSAGGSQQNTPSAFTDSKVKYLDSGKPATVNATCCRTRARHAPELSSSWHDILIMSEKKKSNGWISFNQQEGNAHETATKMTILIREATHKDNLAMSLHWGENKIYLTKKLCHFGQIIHKGLEWIRLKRRHKLTESCRHFHIIQPKTAENDSPWWRWISSQQAWAYNYESRVFHSTSAYAHGKFALWSHRRRQRELAIEIRGLIPLLWKGKTVPSWWSYAKFNNANF